MQKGENLENIIQFRRCLRLREVKQIDGWMDAGERSKMSWK